MGSNEASKHGSERVSNCLLYLVFKSLKFTFIKSAETLYIIQHYLVEKLGMNEFHLYKCRYCKHVNINDFESLLCTVLI